MKNDDGIERPKIKIPEKKATQVSAHLRQAFGKDPIALSVYGFVNQKGIQGIQIQVDHRQEDGEVDQYELNYNAKSDPYAICRHAVKRIRARFDM